jgi:hypothetical protein
MLKLSNSKPKRKPQKRKRTKRIRIKSRKLPSQKLPNPKYLKAASPKKSRRPKSHSLRSSLPQRKKRKIVPNRRPRSRKLRLFSQPPQ